MGTPRRVATITMHDSIERGAADECEPLRGRQPRTFTLMQLFVACVAVCVCAIAATKAVNTHEDYPEGAQLGRHPFIKAKAAAAKASRYTMKIKGPRYCHDWTRHKVPWHKAGDAQVKWRIFIVRYAETKKLRDLIDSLLEGDLPRISGGSFEIFVLNNKGIYCDPAESNVILPDNVFILDNPRRSAGTQGYLARDSNAALVLGFQNLEAPAAEHVIHCHADVKFEANAFSILSEAHKNYDFVQWGIGDQLSSYKVAAVKQIGLWDERFNSIFYQEEDYFQRIAALMPKSASLNCPEMCGFVSQNAITKWELKPKTLAVTNKVLSDDSYRNIGNRRREAWRPKQSGGLCDRGKYNLWVFNEGRNKCGRFPIYPHFENGHDVGIQHWPALKMEDGGFCI